MDINGEAVIVSTLGMAISATMGSLFSHEGIWLYCVIALLVASYYPETLENALIRGSFPLLGGGLQLMGMMLSAKFFLVAQRFFLLHL